MCGGEEHDNMASGHGFHTGPTPGNYGEYAAVGYMDHVPINGTQLIPKQTRPPVTQQRIRGGGEHGQRGNLVVVKCCLMSSDVSWHIRDKLWPMPKHGSIILYVHGNQKAR